MHDEIVAKQLHSVNEPPLTNRKEWRYTALALEKDSARIGVLRFKADSRHQRGFFVSVTSLLWVVLAGHLRMRRFLERGTPTCKHLPALIGVWEGKFQKTCSRRHIMSNITLFSFEKSSIRVINLSGDIWFVASDIAIILSYRDAHNMMRILEEDEKGTHNVSTLGGDQAVSIINESGLYHAILKSRKPEAKKFRKWVTSEVLPSIRRSGGYIHTPAMRPALTKEQKYLLKKKIDEITRGSDYSTHCQNVYNHLRVAFQVARVDDIPQDYFDAAMSLIEQKREASFQFYTFLREIKDWYSKNVLGGGHPWTPHIKRELTKKLKRQVILPPKVDWLALAEEVKKK